MILQQLGQYEEMPKRLTRVEQFSNSEVIPYSDAESLHHERPCLNVAFQISYFSHGEMTDTRMLTHGSSFTKNLVENMPINVECRFGHQPEHAPGTPTILGSGSAHPAVTWRRMTLDKGSERSP